MRKRARKALLVIHFVVGVKTKQDASISRRRSISARSLLCVNEQGNTNCNAEMRSGFFVLSYRFWLLGSNISRKLSPMILIQMVATDKNNAGNNHCQ